MQAKPDNHAAFGARSAARAVAVGWALFVAACALPWIGIFRGGLGTTIFQSYGDRILGGAIPYHAFALEYPPGSLPAFAIPSFAPAGDYRTAFMLFEAASGLGCIALVAAATRSSAAAAYCALAPLALGPLTLHRFDLWPTLLATAGVVSLMTARERRGVVALALGTSAKVFPVVLLGPAIVDARRRLLSLAWFCAALLVVFLPFVLVAPGGVRSSVERQFDRPLQVETLASSALLALHAIGVYTPRVEFGSGSWNLAGPAPDALAAVATPVAIAAVVAVWLLYARTPATPRRLATASAAAVAAWITFGKVLSPQFLVWLVPLVALARWRRDSVLLVAALALSRSVYPARYDALVALHTTPIVLLCLRNAVLLALVASLVLRLQRQGVTEQVGAERERSDAREGVVLDRRERNRPDGVPRLEPREGE